MTLVAALPETENKQASAKPPKVGAAPLVPGKRHKHKAFPPVKGNKALLSTYGLQVVNKQDIKPGAQLIHIVRNQANVGGCTSTHYRPAIHECTVMALTPNRVRVRFANGAVKAVKHSSLFLSTETFILKEAT